jgi:tripartite-type tricarboxylate transporter receptor subunit TctC
MTNNFKKWSAACLTALMGGVPAVSSAAWPDDQTIELVVGFAPGGGTDLMARALVPFVEKKLGGKARVVVVNKPVYCPRKTRRLHNRFY